MISPWLIPYGKQSINQSDIDAVVDVLQSDWLTQGPSVEHFERAVVNHCGAKHAVSVTNATSALHMACSAAGLGPGDILWTSPNTFVASANCGLYCGAKVDFVDIDPRSYNMSVEKLQEKLEGAALTGQLPKVVIPVHFSGQSCNMESIAHLAKRYGFIVIEDASHAIGGNYRGEPVGSCRFSDMAVFSFHPVKIITSGEGGMVLTNNTEFYSRMERFRTHGITRKAGQMVGECQGPWYYEQVELGYNYRMSDIQAALGVSQFKRLDEFVARRHDLAKRYDDALDDLPVVRPWQSSDSYSAFHLYVIRLCLDRISKSRREVIEELRLRNIFVNIHYIPVHLQPYYAQMGFSVGDFEQAETYYREAMTLPLYYSLKDEEQDYVVAAIREIIS